RRRTGPKDLEIGSPVVLDRDQVAPAPHQRFVRTEDHVHRRILDAVAVSLPFAFRHKEGGEAFVDRATVRVEDAAGVAAFHQVMVTYQGLLTGNGAVVTEEIKRPHVAVEEVPAVVVEHLRDAMAGAASGPDWQAGGVPEPSQADGIIAAGGVAVDIEDL